MPRHNDPAPIDRKFGYEVTEEKRRIRNELADKGMNDPELHFEVERIYTERHKNDLTFRQRQEIWLKEQKARPLTIDRYKNALQQIADGHNDPRKLAIETLEKERHQ